MVNGGKTAVDTILDHPKVRAVSFVGSTSRGEIYLRTRRCQR